MKKSKGFVFIETIVVVVILSVGLVMIYQSFVNVLANNKRRAAYNDIAYIYRTYYVQDFINSLKIDDYLDYYLVKQNKKLIRFDCKSPMLYSVDANVTSANFAASLSADDQAKMALCERLYTDYKIKNVYITNYNVNDIKKCTTRRGMVTSACRSNSMQYEVLSNMTPTMIYYMRTLSGNIANTYRLIVEYEETVIDSDNTVTKIKKGGSWVCPNTFTASGSTCYKNVTKRYYANMAFTKKI